MRTEAKNSLRVRLLAGLCLLLLSCVLSMPASAANIVDSGYCGGEGDGTNLTWTLDSDGLLTISGKGEMENDLFGFEQRANIKTVKINNGVTSIGSDAFYDCGSLTSVTIPNSVTSIGDDAFLSCGSLTDITIPNSVMSIGEWAFCGCSSLKSIIIPDGVTSIGEYTFYDCSSLTDITISNSVTSIGNCAFEGCGNLTSITIPNSVTSIGEYALGSCSSLTSITIPNSVMSIGDGAFSCCDNLQYNLFGNAKYLGNADNPYLYLALSINDSILECSIHQKTRFIGELAFSGCKNLTSITIPDSVVSIGGAAFYGCENVESIIVSANVLYIGECAFGCKNILVASDNKFYQDIGGVLFNREKTQLLGYPAGRTDSSYTIPSSVTVIGKSAFNGCGNLTSITIPNSVTSVGDRAFSDCSSLVSITIPNGVTIVGPDTFSGCSSLTSITLPKSITYIGVGAFSDCTSLDDIFFLGNAPTIDMDMDYPSFPLGVILYYTPGTTGWTDSDAYDANAGTWNGYTLRSWGGKDEEASIVDSGYCGGEGVGMNLTWTLDSDGLLTISGRGVMENGVFWLEQRASVKTVKINKGVTSIGAGAFSDCSSLTSITIPNSVTSIGTSAFEDCSSLTSITIPSSVTSIGEWAFQGCSSLTSINIPDSVTSIGHVVFRYCSSLTSVTIPDSVISIGAGAFAGCSSLTEIAIPSSVTSIDNSAFADCSSLADITIPNSVTSIGDDIFNGCSNLTSIIIPDSVTSIGDGMFQDCSSLKSIIIPSGVTSIGAGAFNGCSSLRSVNIPNSVTSVGNGAFRDCSSLTSINIPNSVTSIGKSAFNGCSSLRSVNIPNSVTSIDDSAFYRCSSLASITIPNGVTSIGKWAFGGCNSLSSIILPNSVTSIDYGAFQSCDRLKLVYYGGTEEQWKSIAISGGNEYLQNATIHYNSNLSENQENVTFNTGSYYAPPKSPQFQIVAQGAGYPAVTGFTVTVDGVSFTSGYKPGEKHFTEQFSVTIPDGYDGDIIISREGYYTYSLPAFFASGIFNVITMVPTSVKGPFAQTLLMDCSQGSYSNFRNMIAEEGGVYELDFAGAEKPETSRLVPVINWNGHGSGSVWLEQNGQTIPLTNEAFNTVCLPEKFAANKTIYLCAEAADGAVLRQALKLKIIARAASGLKLDLGEAVEIDTSKSSIGNLDILSNETLKVDFSKITKFVPVSFTIKGDGSIEGVIGVKAEGKDTQAVFGSMKNSLDRLADESDTEKARKIANLVDEMKKANVLGASQSSEFGIKGNVNILGYFTGKIIDGRPKLTETKLVLSFSGSMSYTHNTVISVGPIPVPAYFKSTLEAKLECYLKMILDNKTNDLMPDGDRRDVTIKISVEAGPGWEGYRSGGVKGTANVKISMIVPVQDTTSSASIQADVCFVGTLCGINGEWRPKGWQTPEMVFYDRGEWCWKRKDSLSTQTLSFYPDLTIATMSMSGAGVVDAIAAGVSGYTAPVLEILPDGRMLAAWMADVPGRSTIDKGGVYYSSYTNGVWSDALLINDDGTNDSVPQLYVQNDVVYAAWQNYTTVFNMDSLPDYDTIVDQLSYVTSSFDANLDTWSVPATITEDEFRSFSESRLPADYEGEWPATMSIRKDLDNGSMRAVLYTALDNSEAEQVYGLFDDGYGWGEPVQLTKEIGGVNGFDAALNSGSISILYTTGDYANATLKLCEASLAADLSVTDVDYIRQTLVPGNELTILTTVKNNSPTTINGVHISVANAGNVVHEEDISVRFNSGKESILYVNYALPKTIDFDSLTVTATPVIDDDADESDNSAVCTLYLTDVSVENVSAVCVDGITEVSALIVNRGQTTTTATTLIYHKETPDGEVIGTEAVPAMQPGDVESIVTYLNALPAGDMVYVEAVRLTDENIIGNNSSHAVVLESAMNELGLSANASQSEDSLTISIDVSNNTTESMNRLNLVAVTYDENGKLLDTKCFSNITLAALNSIEQTVTLSINSAKKSVIWKVFLLDEGWIPLTKSVSGMTSL